jgi:hypothetical protein
MGPGTFGNGRAAGEHSAGDATGEELPSPPRRICASLRSDFSAQSVAPEGEFQNRLKPEDRSSRHGWIFAFFFVILRTQPGSNANLAADLPSAILAVIDGLRNLEPVSRLNFT